MAALALSRQPLNSIASEHDTMAEAHPKGWEKKTPSLSLANRSPLRCSSHAFANLIALAACIAPVSGHSVHACPSQLCAMGAIPVIKAQRLPPCVPRDFKSSIRSTPPRCSASLNPESVDDASLAEEPPSAPETQRSNTLVVAVLTSTALVSEVTQIGGTVLLLRLLQSAMGSADLSTAVGKILVWLTSLRFFGGLWLLLVLQIFAQAADACRFLRHTHTIERAGAHSHAPKHVHTLRHTLTRSLIVLIFHRPTPLSTFPALLSYPLQFSLTLLGTVGRVSSAVIVAEFACRRESEGRGGRGAGRS
eukprot:6128822-Pleurochrysis_carterae.AAC.3